MLGIRTVCGEDPDGDQFVPLGRTDDVLIGALRLPENDGGLAEGEVMPPPVEGRMDGALDRPDVTDEPNDREPDEGRYDFVLPPDGEGELDRLYDRELPDDRPLDERDFVPADTTPT